ncbi:MAG TPA: FkbM family methyltransferase [Isosphaeraceae bacterium]|nr:FkbM family methyltransferase [Isosphaeraceae bacterium]
MAMTLRKIGQGVRLLLDVGTWRDAVAEARRPRPSPRAAPEVRVIEDDPAGQRLVEVAGDRYWIPASMDWSSFGMLYPEVFDAAHPHYYEFGPCRVRPGDVVVDAGASEGLFTRFALARGARVIAVEPFGPMAEALRRTFAPEVSAGTVRVEQAAVSDRPGVARLTLLDPSQPWGATVSPEGDGNGAGEVVHQVTIDELVERSGWGRCDFLKMDVEGAERAAVAGASATLRRDRPRLSIAVYHFATGFVDIRGDLAAAGLGYVVRGKGMTRRRGVLVPTILHAWPAGSD